MEILTTVLAFLLIFGILIFVHELGHFIMAKRAGVKVEEFAFGLPLLPKIFALKRGETTYSVYPVPLGGFVRMLGEEGDDKSPRSFASKSPGTRAGILIAGVAMNLLLAIVLLTVGFFLKMPPLALCASDYPGTRYENKVTFEVIADPSPAHEAGLRGGDTVRTIAGTPVQCGQDVPRLVSQHPGEPIAIGIERDGQPQTITVTPKPKNEAGAGRIGVAPKDDYSRLEYPWWGAPYYAALETLAVTKATVAALGNVFVTLVTQASIPEGVAGPVGIAELTGQVVDLGPITMLRFVAILSLSLAVFNILPIPALDGGRLIFVFIELLRGGRPVTAKTEGAVHAIGFALLILFIAFITYFDIKR